MNENKMSALGYAILENYEVYGNTEDEEELCTRDTLIEYIADLEAAQRWIPVSERLPEDKKYYMAVVMNCYDGSRDIYRLQYYGDGNWFSWTSEIHVVTHWKESPDLPEVQE